MNKDRQNGRESTPQKSTTILSDALEEDKDGRLSQDVVSILNAFETPAFILSRSMTIAAANQAMHDRYRDQSIINKRYGELPHSDLSGGVDNPVRAVLESGVPARLYFDDESSAASGGEISIFPITGNGAATHVLCLIQGAGQSRRRSPSYGNNGAYTGILIDSLDEPVLLLDRDGIILEINKTGALLTSRPRQDVIGRSASCFFPAELVELYSAQAEEAFLQGEKNNFEVSLNNRRYKLTVSPITGADGTMDMIAVSARDVTDSHNKSIQLADELGKKNALLKEIHHRVKNNLTLASSLLGLQADVVKDDRVKAVFRESQTRITSMAMIHELLYQTDSLAEINLQEYLERLTGIMSAAYSRPGCRIRITVKAQGVNMGVNQAVPCGLFINELISNSLKHAFPEAPEGRLVIEATELNGMLTIRFTDDGKGFPPGFDWRSSNTLGLFLAVGLIEKQLDGELEMNSSVRGVEVRASFKLGK